MEKKLDLRIQKTYLTLTNTFLQMLKEMPFEEIRISELCDRAMIRKSTFYKHFGDKYELLVFIVRKAQENLNRELENKCSDDILDYYINLIKYIFDFLEENRALFQTAFQSNSFPSVLDIVSEQIIRDIQQRLKSDKHHGEQLPASPNTMATFFVGGILEIAYNQLQSGTPLNDDHLQTELINIIKHMYHSPINITPSVDNQKQ